MKRLLLILALALAALTSSARANPDPTEPITSPVIIGGVLQGPDIIWRVITASDATSLTPTAGTVAANKQANTQNAGTLTINSPSGALTDFQPILIRIKCTNAQTLSWNAIYRGSTDLALPTSCAAGKTSYYKGLYNSVDTRVDVVGKNEGF